jgi:hypothetical protein
MRDVELLLRRLEMLVERGYSIEIKIHQDKDHGRISVGPMPWAALNILLHGKEEEKTDA